jgi:hypothetical protein
VRRAPKAQLGRKQTFGNYPEMTMRIEVDDLARLQVHELLREHLQSMHALSPPESVHALDVENFGNRISRSGPFGTVRRCLAAARSRS